MVELILKVVQDKCLLLQSSEILLHLLFDIINEGMWCLASIVQKDIQIREESRNICAFRYFLIVLGHLQIDRSQIRVHFVSAFNSLRERTR